jgi:uncharacterized membrane protein YgcG
MLLRTAYPVLTRFEDRSPILSPMIDDRTPIYAPPPSDAAARHRPPTAAKPPANERLLAYRRRLWRIRKRLIVTAVVTFAVLWSVIFVQLVSGHDPALAKKSAAATSSAASGSGTTGSTSSGTSSSGTSSSGSGTTSPVTTSQS